MDCCDFPKLVPKPTVQRCMSQFQRANSRRKKSKKSLPGGMCLFNCFAKNTSLLGTKNNLSERKVKTELKKVAKSYKYSNEWEKMIDNAIRKTYKDYKSMKKRIKEAESDGKLQKKSCPSSTGYFFARLNAELFTV